MPAEAKKTKSGYDITTEIVRDNKVGKTIFKFNVPAEVEKLYETISTEKKESSAWINVDGRPLSFYACPNITTNVGYQQKASSFMLFDDFGSSLIKNGRMNIAWLRTVGGNGELEITEPISVAQLSEFTRRMADFIKLYFEEYFRDAVIKSKVTVEI